MAKTLFEIVEDEETEESVKRVHRLSEMETKEISIVDRAANKKKFLVVKRKDETEGGESDDVDKVVTRTDGGQEFPAGAYAYVPDPTKPSTWKLKLFDMPGDVPNKPSVVLTAAAAQALSPAGFRGNQVQIPSADLAGVKQKVRAAWLKARAGRPPEERQLPTVLKNAEEAAVGDTTVVEAETTNKNLVAARIDAALTRVKAVKAVLEGAEVKKGADLPEVVGSELRSIQFMLKTLAGVAKSVAFMVPAARDVEDCGEIDAKVKKSAEKVLAEIEKRLSALSADLGDSEMLDSSQAKKVDSAADMISKVLHSGGKKVLVVVKGSLSDDQRDALLSEVEKALVGLGDLYVALQTDVVVKGVKVAGEHEIGSMLHGHAASIEKAVSAMLMGMASPRVLSQTLVEDMREIEKSLGAEHPMAFEPLNEVVCEIKKAATMYRARWGSGDKASVVLSTADTKIAEFDSYEEAEMDALRRNIEAVSKIAKRYVVKAGGPKGYQVMDGEKAVGDYDTEEAAKKAAGRMNVAGACKPRHKNEEGSVSDDSTKTEGSETGVSEGDVKKVGRPMQGDRLNRFKAAIAMLKEFAGDMLAGTLCLEKFEKAIDDLGVVMGELEVTKGMAAAQTGGVADERGTGPNSQNAGSGSHPGEAEGEISEDSRLNEVLKRLETVEAERKNDKAAIERQRAEIRMLKKRRAAPSTPPIDSVGDGKKTSTPVSAWPRDLNDL